MQVKLCPKDNTKIHYFDDNFEYHTDIKLNTFGSMVPDNSPVDDNEIPGGKGFI